MHLIFDIKLSKKDKERGLKIPHEVTNDLAYLSGILIGDGHLRFDEREHRYSISCVGHPKDEKDLYDKIIAPLIERLFGIKTVPTLCDGGTTYGIRIGSKSLVYFFSEVIGLPTGAKSGIITIPEIFKKREPFLKAFIRGYADTDFCLTLKKRYRNIQYYPVIVGVSKSKRIMKELVAYLESQGFIVSRDFNRKYYDKRFGKYTITHRFQLYGHKQLVHWMRCIGFSNPKHLRKFELWRKRNLTHSRRKVRGIAGGGFEFGNGPRAISTDLWVSHHKPTARAMSPTSN